MIKSAVKSTVPSSLKTCLASSNLCDTMPSNKLVLLIVIFALSATFLSILPVSVPSDTINASPV